jgi:LmbE family N-acetylglucosaminyl deacetylase
VIDDPRHSRHWIEAHTNWIPCKLPHFSIRDNAFYFLAAERPLLVAPSSMLELTAAVDGNVDIEAIVTDSDDIDALAQLWAAGIVTFVPPGTLGAGPCILAIEPHPDDVALSAGGALLLRRDTTRKIILSVASRSNATLYMATPELRYFDVDMISKLRHEESLLAARFLKAQYHTLNEPDIPIRYVDPECYTRGDIHLTMREQGAHRHAPPSSSQIERVSALLWRTIREFSPDEIWLPLGLGNHFDHRLTRDAGLNVTCRHWTELQSVKLMFYEDLPYAWCYPGIAETVLRMMRQRGAKLERHSLDIGSVFDDKIECLTIYASQFEIENMRSVIDEYGRLASGTGEGYGETLWQLTRPPSFPFAPLVVARGMPHRLIEEAARQVFERRTFIRSLGLMIGNQVSHWVEPAQTLAKLFPNAILDVLAVSGNRDRIAATYDSRFRLSFFDESKWSLLVSFIRWALHWNETVLIFGGARRAREVGWLAKVLPSRHVYVFENLEDMCGLWRYWLEEKRDGK